jgi:hypothetical protein
MHCGKEQGNPDRFFLVPDSRSDYQDIKKLGIPRIDLIPVMEDDFAKNRYGGEHAKNRNPYVIARQFLFIHRKIPLMFL